MKNKNAILILLLLIQLSYIYSNNWNLQIDVQNNDQTIPGDWIILGVCEGCNDGFQYNEDEIELPDGPIDMTDIQFMNLDWIGQIDTNGVECEIPTFSSDYRSIHPPSDLQTWNITGSCAEEVSNSIGSTEYYWDDDSLNSDYEIYFYFNDTGYNMRYTSGVTIDCDNIGGEYEQIDGEWIYNTNIKILMGGCASSGLTTFYFDGDGDGLGSGVYAEYCNGFQPDGWVINDTDFDDNIFCESNNFDDCWVCDGGNQLLDCAGVCDSSTPIGMTQSEEGYEYGAFFDDCGICSGGESNHQPNIDMDCNGDCFGTAFIDDCGICSSGETDHIPNSDFDCADVCFGEAFIDYCGECDGFNTSCLELIFGDGPSNLYAQIIPEENIIYMTWIYYDINSSGQVQGYKIYIENGDQLNLVEEVLSTEILSHNLSGYNSGTFCISASDIYQNETDPLCTEASELSNYNFTLDDGANLLSFPYLSNEDASIETIFNSIVLDTDGIISEGVASSYNPVLGWTGTIAYIERDKGYWVKVILEDDMGSLNFAVSGIETDHSMMYYLHDGANLVSYIGPDNINVGDAIPDSIEEHFEAIIGQGVAASPDPILGWVGSLSMFNIGKGYWIKVDPDITYLEMIWNSDNTASSRASNNIADMHSDFTFTQSSQQAFYFLNDIDVSTIDIDSDDVLLSYCNGVMVGSRHYSEKIDIPAMGYDGTQTAGYCVGGDIPQFKVFDSETGRVIDLFSDSIPAWQDLGIFHVELTEQSPAIPVKSGIASVYPNPFNPSTKIQFATDVQQHVELAAYNISGKLIDIVYSGILQPGEYSFVWNAGNNSTGVYFIKATAGMETSTRKILFIK